MMHIRRASWVLALVGMDFASPMWAKDADNSKDKDKGEKKEAARKAKY
jgi:hypothetical protein